MKFDDILKKITFLEYLPKNLLATLNFKEFHLPNDHLNFLRQSLEKELNCYLMTYRSQPFYSENLINLCHLLQPATLTQEQILKLKDMELKFKNIILVAYAKPLKFK